MGGIAASELAAIQRTIRPGEAQSGNCRQRKGATVIRVNVLVAACMVFLVGCGKKASEEIDFGAVQGSVYRNNYFGMSVELPPKWSVQDQKARQQIMDLGAKAVAGDDKNLNAALKAAEMQTVNLLAAFKHPVGSPVAFNPNIICIAERIHHMPGIKRGKDYHYHSKRQLESSQLKVTFPKNIYTKTLGGVDFDVMTTQMSLGVRSVKQKQFAAVRNRYALVFVISFTSDEEEAELTQVLNTVAFGK